MFVPFCFKKKQKTMAASMFWFNRTNSSCVITLTPNQHFICISISYFQHSGNICTHLNVGKLNRAAVLLGLSNADIGWIIPYFKSSSLLAVSPLEPEDGGVNEQKETERWLRQRNHVSCCNHACDLRHRKVALQWTEPAWTWREH